MARAAAPRSIRRELLWVLLTSVAVTWVATTIVSYLDTRHEIDELLDAHLAQSASLLIAQAGHDWDEIVEHCAAAASLRARRRVPTLGEGNGSCAFTPRTRPIRRFRTKSEGFSNVDGGRRALACLQRVE